jgi:hypothetical protein
MLTSLSPPCRYSAKRDYVRSEYIGTVECFSSSTLCGKWLNRCKGFRPVLLTYKPLHNIGEETFTRETGELQSDLLEEKSSREGKLSHFLKLKKGGGASSLD